MSNKIETPDFQSFQLEVSFLREQDFIAECLAQSTFTILKLVGNMQTSPILG